MLPAVMGGAGQGGIWAVPPAIISLCSLASMQRSVSSHYLPVLSRMVKRAGYTLIHLVAFDNMLKKSLRQRRKTKPNNQQ